MPASPSRTIHMMQTLFDGKYSLIKIPTMIIKESDVTSEVLSVFEHPRPLGISPGYSSTGKLVALAIVDDQHGRIIEFNVPAHRRSRSNANPSSRNLEGLQILQEKILCRTAGDLFAFDMGPLAMSLYSDANLRITNAVDVQTGASAVDRKPLTIIKAVVGTTLPIKEVNIATIFGYPEYKTDDRNYSATDLAMRAWVSQFLSWYDNGAEMLEKVPRIDTLKLEAQVLDMISKVATDALRLDQLKPTQSGHRFTTAASGPGESSTLIAAGYKDKFRRGQVRVVVRDSLNREYVSRGKMFDVKGKSGSLNMDHLPQNKSIKTITSIGRDDPTTADAQRAATVLRILQGAEKLLNESPWIGNIWFPSDDGLLTWPEDWSLPPSPQSSTATDGNPIPVIHHALNPSQQEAVNTMHSTLDSHRITIIQGPPGTGKTSVIASFVQVAVQTGYNGIWLVAQSNVAVKNIAEKLLDVGFLEWKLLVSKDFHYDWHEHIYTKVQDNVIRSDRFFSYPSKLLKGCKVMLCTLSMLSNENLSKFSAQNPVKTLVVDEASQIEVGNYIPVFSQFNSTLRKACFIGDDQQLPPYGQEDLQDLQSIFEISHLRKHVLFLDTQYRMPPQIGRIISDAIYDGKLKSNPLHPVTDETIACYFIDAPGQEKRLGNSFMNPLECKVVIKLAQILQDQGKSYQIITPYEGQRGTIEQEMKSTPDLNWANKCFNVDSFQGNEQDYIIISLVRSRELGFLDNKRRTNVMLTRCKVGMYIVSSQRFLSEKGANTLVGILSEKVGQEAWLDMKAIEEENI